MVRSVTGFAAAALLAASFLVPAATSFAQAATVATDGQSLSSQPAATQASFVAVWGPNAAAEWAREHDAALKGQPAGPSPYPMAGAKPAAPAAPSVTKLTPETVAIPPAEGKTLSVDIMWVDQASHRLYAADRTTDGVDVFDVSTPLAQYMTTVDTGSGPNGVVAAPNLQEVFAGLNNSTIAVIDVNPSSPTFNQVIASIPTGGAKRTDELDYDPVDNKVYAANSDDGIVTVVDGASNTIIKQFTDMGPGLEQPRYDTANGMMYMTSSDQNVVFEFDPKTDTQVNKWTVSDACNPNGLDIDPRTNMGMLGCSNKKTPHTDIMDMTSGKVVKTFNELGGSDGVVFNEKANRFFTGSSNDPRGAGVGVYKADPAAYLTQIPTFAGSHGIAYDETNNVIYTQDQRPNSARLMAFPAPDANQ